MDGKGLAGFRKVLYRTLVGRNNCRQGEEIVDAGQGALGSLVGGPVEYRQTQFDHRAVDRQQFVLESEFTLVILGFLLASAQQILEDILIQLPRTVLVGVGQGRVRRRAIHAQMLQLPLAASQAARDLSQRLGMTKLAEHHRAELVPTGEPVLPVLGLLYGGFELQARDELQNLTENAAYSIHGGVVLVDWDLFC